MSKHRKFTIGLAVAVPLLIGLAFLWREREPRYQGRALGSWLIDLNPTNEPARITKATVAVQTMGARAVPHLLNWLQYERFPRFTRTAYRIIRWAMPSMADKLDNRWQTKIDRAEYAHRAIVILGDRADAAIPELTKRLTNGKLDTMEGEVMRRAAGDLLADLAPRGLPPLISALTNQTTTVRCAAAESLQFLPTNKEGAIPHLIRALKDSDSDVVNAVLTSLHSYTIEPDIAVPAFMSCLQHTNERTRELAAFHLGVYHRDAQPAATRLIQLLSDPDANVRTAATNAVFLIAPKALISATAQ